MYTRPFLLFTVAIAFVFLARVSFGPWRGGPSARGILARAAGTCRDLTALNPEHG